MKKINQIISALESEYPDVHCELTYSRPHELLIATRLSAQCTDHRVNMVTPALFERFTTIGEFAQAEVEDVEELIKSCGLFKTKANDIVMMCRKMMEEFSGEVPDTLEKLLTLPGVGRKTANLIMGDLYGKPAIVTDTHVIRLSNRIGLADTKDPYKVEKALVAVIPPEKSMAFCHRLVWHGRRACTARKPNCDGCAIKSWCDKNM